MFSNIDIPVLLFDTNGKLVTINEVGCTNMGVSMREATELPCNNVFCRMKTPPVECPVRKVLDTRKAAEFNLKCNKREYLIKAKPIFDEYGKLVYILECALDMTDINTVQRKLTYAVREAQESNRAKTDFISTMNHELRTPLNAVIGFSELLKAGVEDPELERDYISSIYSSGQSLLTMVNDILDIAKLDADQIVINMVKVDLCPVLKQICGIYKQLAEAKNVEFKLIMPAFLPDLYIDTARVRQILANILGNAVKFTYMGSVSLTTLFEPIDRQKGRLSIAVSDTGIGIKDDILPEIFKPFVQDDQVRNSRAYQGSGLGLSIAKKLADAMGGKIEVSSCENIGSTFTFVLDNVKFDFPSEVKYIPENNNGGRLLIVDDLPMNLRILEALLKKLGMKCVSAESGKDALRLMQSENFDIVLTDIWMPDMNGVELARAIRINGGESKNIFAITADADWNGDSHSVLFNGIFHKPIGLKDLKSILSKSVMTKDYND